MEYPDNGRTDVHLHATDDCVGIIVLERCLNKESFYVGLDIFLDCGQLLVKGKC